MFSDTSELLPRVCVYVLYITLINKNTFILKALLCICPCLYPCRSPRQANPASLQQAGSLPPVEQKQPCFHHLILCHKNLKMLTQNSNAFFLTIPWIDQVVLAGSSRELLTRSLCCCVCVRGGVGWCMCVYGVWCVCVYGVCVCMVCGVCVHVSV